MILWQFFKAPRQVDETFYLTEYPDVRDAGLTAAAHYTCYGAQEGRHPNALAKALSPSSWPALAVDPSYYDRAYPDVARSRMSARSHYVRWGRAQGRHPNALAEEASLLKASLLHLQPDGLFRSARRGRDILTGGLIRWLRLRARLRRHNLVCGLYDVDRLPEAGARYALRPIEPSESFAFTEPGVCGRPGAPRERHLMTPAQWVAEVEDATVIGAFQVLRSDRLIVYEPAADPRYAFAAGASRHVAPLGGGDRAVVHFPYRRTERVPAAILLSGRCSPNYFHWLIEYLAKAYTISRDPRLAGLPVIVDAGMFPSEFESLALVMEGRPVILRRSDEILHVDRLFIPSQPTFHPDDIAVPFWQGAALCRPSLDFLRSAVLEKIPAGEPRFPARVYLARRTGRTLTNAAEVEAELEALGFAVIDPAALDFAQQVDLFRNAEMLVGAMGAAFSNLIFCRPGTRVLTLSSPFTQDFCMQANLARFAGCDYTILAGTHPAYGDTEATQGRTLGLMLDDYAIEIEALRRALAELTRAERASERRDGPAAGAALPSAFRRGRTV